MRPQPLAEVAELTLQGESFNLCLREFLDEFYAHPNAEALIQEPIRLGGTAPQLDAVEASGLPQDPALRMAQVRDAYLAAVAESLACSNQIDTPSWAYVESRKLKRPWFALEYASLRAVLLVESPAAFRSRNLFVSENALSRV